jgi:hypothetical protein
VRLHRLRSARILDSLAVASDESLANLLERITEQQSQLRLIKNIETTWAKHFVEPAAKLADRYEEAADILNSAGAELAQEGSFAPRVGEKLAVAAEAYASAARLQRADAERYQADVARMVKTVRTNWDKIRARARSRLSPG